MVQRNQCTQATRQICQWPDNASSGDGDSRRKGQREGDPGRSALIASPPAGLFSSDKKEQMKKKSPGQEVDQQLLFHGTSASHLAAICEQNFDWRVCGAHGTLYGRGSYFARDASYSHEYCPSRTGHQSMFVARVLVGDFVEGNSEYLRPPPRAGNANRLYDSCVDDPEDPSIFVIFEKHQVYPAYILEYTFSSQ
nr:PREDICTED: poly [ADP-ribose] polymerase 12-like [Struthio camelus australis]XP_009678248.1 PREDICTED: poly [ADP-ribose] polymerase 12-like [Struthio camelus australis]